MFMKLGVKQTISNRCKVKRPFNWAQQINRFVNYPRVAGWRSLNAWSVWSNVAFLFARFLTFCLSLNGRHLFSKQMKRIRALYI